MSSNIIYRSSFKRGIRGFCFRNARWQYSICHNTAFRMTYLEKEELLQFHCCECGKLCHTVAILPPLKPIQCEHYVGFYFRNDRLFVRVVPWNGEELVDCVMDGTAYSTGFNPVFVPKEREQPSAYESFLDYFRV